MSTINGTSVSDSLVGTSRSDDISGGSGNDLIDGGAGHDEIEGGSGNDTISGGYGNDEIEGGRGDDVLDGGAGNDELEGGRGNDTLYGGAGNDELEGGRGDDFLDGGTGKDELEGGSGNDILVGGAGADRLEGGSGCDVFAYQNASDSAVHAWDRILDFNQGQDKIDLSALLCSENLAWGNQSAIANGAWFLNSGSSTFVLVDVTGNGKADFKIELKNSCGLALTSDDFIGVSDGTNNAPVLTLDASGEVTEDANDSTLSDTGALSFTDADVSDTHTVSSAFNNAVWTDGTLTAGQITALTSGFSVDSNSWDYMVANSALQFLGAGETIALSFNVTVTDNSGAANNFDTEIVMLTLTGVNDAATISGDTSGDVTEDGSLSDGGTLTVSDVDSGEAHAKADSGSTALGSYSVDSNGHWNYTVNSAAVQHLGKNDSDTDSFTVFSLDGTASQQVTVTIHGVNDAAAISGTASGDVTEDDSLSDSDMLNVSDVDDGESFMQAASGSTALGSYSVDSNGHWNYTVNNEAVQHLGKDDTDTDTFTVFSSDGSASQQVTVTIHGVNDTPTLADEAADTVVDTVAFDDFQAINGSLDGDDVDNDAMLTYTLDAGEDGVGAFGTLVVNADGSYTYNPNGAAVNALSDADLVNDTFAVRVTDEHGAFAIANLTVTLDGANDAPLAAPDFVLTNVLQGTSFVIPGFALLANDTDVEGDPLSLGTVTSDGYVSLVGGNVVHDNTPTQGGDFKYTAFDGMDHSALANVNVGTKPGDIIGTLQNEILIGSENGETLLSDDPSDPLLGSGGSDFLFGNGGDDTLGSFSDHSMLFGGSGGDTLQSSAKHNTLFGGEGDDFLQSLTGADNTTLDGGGGADVLVGGVGTTTMDGGAGADLLLGGDGTNTASYASASAGATVDLLSGVAFNDGHGSSDSLFGIQNVTGSAFNDTLVGDGLANLLTGGAGNDMLVGGLGNDIFDYNLLADRGTTGDVIFDFSKAQGDKLDLHDLLTTFSGYDGTNAFTGGYLNLVPSGSNTVVQVDSDGTGGSDAVTLATVNNVTLDAGDFIL